MLITQRTEFEGVLAMVRTWAPELRLSLAEELLRSLRPAISPDSLHGLPATQVCGSAAGDGPPPDDDTIDQWIDEHRRNKYG